MLKANAGFDLNHAGERHCAMNTDTLEQAISRYAEQLEKNRDQEIYKWKATKRFLETFDLAAENLGEMIENSFDESNNLLVGSSWFPKGMLKLFADRFPDETRTALKELFDESLDLKQRMTDFEAWAKLTLSASNDVAASRGEGAAKNHFQDTRSMSAYLAFKYPSAHFLYKATMYIFVADALGLSHPGNKFDKVIAYNEMCDEILSYFEEKHPELIEASDALLADELKDADPEHHLLVQDFVYFMYEYDKARYAGDDPSEVNGNALGDAGVEIRHYWLYAPGAAAGMWDEFYDHDIMGLGWSELGDLSSYSTKEDMRLKLIELRGDETSQKNAAHAVWQFTHDLKPGDIVFVKQGRTKILGRGIVAGDYEYDESAGDYPNIRTVNWTHRGEWVNDEMFAMKTLTDVTDYTDFVAKIDAFFQDDSGEISGVKPVVQYPAYNKQSFLDEVYTSEEQYNMLAGVLKTKRNVILQGAPGVGKTFAAKRLAYSMMGMKDAERVMMIQFHQSYSYEDFIEGYRPSAEGFELIKGAFYTFCKRAAEDSERDYFFIIDEINRGNLSKIFGELFMLIENDKRGPKNKLQLLYSRELFYVPNNVYLIGMMNTADRSLAMLDYALRRRFAFFDLKPGFEADGFVRYREGLESSKFNELVACVTRLNGVISEDETLGDGFCIGHSYFCGIKQEEPGESRLSFIVEYELVPMLREYWFDDPGKVREWSEALRRAIR